MFLLLEFKQSRLVCDQEQRTIFLVQFDYLLGYCEEALLHQAFDLELLVVFKKVSIGFEVSNGVQNFILAIAIRVTHRPEDF